jgi:hypothetical protein
LTAHQCSGGATGRRVRSRTALLRVRISPRTPQARSPTRQRQHAQTVSSVGSNPTEPTIAPVVQPVEATRSKRVECWFESSRAHHTPRLPMVRRADSKPAFWVFESPPGCHAPQQQVVSGRAANSVCAVQFRGGAPSFSHCGGVDALLKSPVPKTGVSPQGPPRVEFPPPPPILTADSIEH